MKRQSNGSDAKTAATLRALRRAARRARELGAKTGTPVYVLQDNRIVDLTKQERPPARRTIRVRETRHAK